MSGDSTTNFDVSDVISEGKAERKRGAEEKRQHDLKLIQSSKEENENGRDPLDVLPEELWELILKNLVEPNDLDIASSTCPLYGGLLEKRTFCEGLITRALQVPGFYRQFKLKELINLRLVCKSLRNAIDNWNKGGWIQNALAPYGKEPNEWLRLKTVALAFPMSNARTGIDYLSRSDALKLAQSFNTSFYGSCKRYLPMLIDVGLQGFGGVDVDFKVKYAEEHFVPFKLLCNDVLKGLGDQLQCFRMILFECDYLSPSAFYLSLLEFIKLVPNIIDLSLLFFKSSFIDEDLETLTQTIRANPFPRLKKLRRFRLFGNKGPEPIIIEIVRRNSHVEQFRLTEEYTSEESMRFLKLLELPKLIRITDFKVILPSILDLNWPLKVVELEFEDIVISAPDVFRMLENFSTLTFVNLSLFQVNFEGKWESDLFLRLPQLTHFVYRYIWDTSFHSFNCQDAPRHYLSVDYLLKCRNLEQLTWVFDLPCETCTEIQMENVVEIVQFKAGYADFAASNIWSLFPFLETVRVNRPTTRQRDQFGLDRPQELQIISRPCNV